jgi:hypothetical protein
MARSHRILRWLRWVVLTLAVAFVATSVWFVMRIERYVLSRLPPEVVVGKLSVSFIGSKFVLNDAQIFGRASGVCAGKLLATAAQIDGGFDLRQRQLRSLVLQGVRVTGDGIDRRCLEKPRQPGDFSLRQYSAADGLTIDLRELVFPAGELGALKIVTLANLRFSEDETLQVSAERLTVTGRHVSLDGRRVTLLFGRAGEAMQLKTASATLVARYQDLSKLPKLSSRKFSVHSGDAELKLTAQYAQPQWSIFTAVELKGVKVGGEPLYNMPMGLLQLSPENLWPMAEDSPGLFSFSFKTRAATGKLPSTYAADLRIALKNKVRANLKKKIPVLPF